MDKIKQLQIALLKEKLEKLTNKKITFKEEETAIVYPKDIDNLITANSEGLNLSQFDKQQIKTLILKAMADTKIVERKDIKLFIDMYVNNKAKSNN